jgi:adenine-specific DNA-methyltransferase
MQKLTSHSPDLVAENIAKLKELFPELLTEGENGSSVNLDVLKSLVGDQTVTDADEKYGLNWHGKRKARQLALTPSTGTLRPCPEDSVDWDTTQNLMIEGDNLEVLKLLQKSYAGKVKMIYIDPPYNTGKDFVYPDNFKDNIKNYLELTGQTGEGGNKLSSNPETSGRFHTDWLNMMYPRLKLARNLLREDGVIFVSIDTGESANLRKVCDEVFGEENFINELVWVKATKPLNTANSGFSRNTESILVYGKRPDLAVKPLPLTSKHEDTYKNPDSDPRGAWTKVPMFLRTNSNKPKALVTPWNGESRTEKWFCSQVTLNELYLENRIIVTNKQVYKKIFLSDSDGRRPLNIMESDLVGYSRNGTEDVKLLELEMDYPKPISLINFLIDRIYPPVDSDFIILDFFCGSATTGHATMKANVEDGLLRRFIMVQLPEPYNLEGDTSKVFGFTIADLSKERLRRAGKKIREEWETKQVTEKSKDAELDLEGNLKSEISNRQCPDLGFRVFKLDSTNIREWDPDREHLAASLEASVDHLKSNRSEQDILFELLLKLGLDLCVPMEQRTIAGKTVHSIGAGVLITCLDKSIARADAEPLAQGILAWCKELKTAGDSTLVFRDSAFADDVAKTNLSKILEQNGIAAKNIRSL